MSRMTLAEQEAEGPSPRRTSGLSRRRSRLHLRRRCRRPRKGFLYTRLFTRGCAMLLFMSLSFSLPCRYGFPRRQGVRRIVVGDAIYARARTIARGAGSRYSILVESSSHRIDESETEKKQEIFLAFFFSLRVISLALFLSRSLRPSCRPCSLRFVAERGRR